MIQTERPEWVEHTPQYQYKLVAFDDGGDSTQEIILHTIEEFIALKAELARLRRIVPEMKAGA